jgi:hypothetical protein
MAVIMLVVFVPQHIECLPSKSMKTSVVILTAIMWGENRAFLYCSPSVRRRDDSNELN